MRSGCVVAWESAKMKITIFCSSETHPVNHMLKCWLDLHQTQHDVVLVRSKSQLESGDILFLISCGEIIEAVDRNKFKKTLVIHASDLPQGRGWSPHVWAILEGADQLVVTLLEAEDKVDSGRVWRKLKIEVPKHLLCHEINALLFEAESQLMTFAVENFHCVRPVVQAEVGSSYYPKRNPDDSELDPEQSISNQFDLMRISDPDRFPAFFRMHGFKYKVSLERVDDE